MNALRTIATAVNGKNVCIEHLSNMTGLSYRMGKEGRKERILFDGIAKQERSKVIGAITHERTINDVEMDIAVDNSVELHSNFPSFDVGDESDSSFSVLSESESSDDSEDDDVLENTLEQMEEIEESTFEYVDKERKLKIKKMRDRENPFYTMLSGKARKANKHKYDGSAIIDFCHDDLYNRIDTAVLGRIDYIVVHQALGDFKFECPRVAQFLGEYAVEEFNKSAYGEKFTVANTRRYHKQVFNPSTGKTDIVEEFIRPLCSRRMFQRHKCRCIIESPKQRDTADSTIRQLDFVILAFSNLLKYNYVVKAAVASVNIDAIFLQAFKSRKSFTDYFFNNCGFLSCEGISIIDDNIPTYEDIDTLMKASEEKTMAMFERKQKRKNNLSDKVSEGPAMKVRRGGNIKGHFVGGLFNWCWKRTCASRTCITCSFKSRVLDVASPIMEAMEVNGVAVKVQAFKDQRRAGGGFQCEIQIEYLTTSEFFTLFETTFDKYAMHQWNNLMSSQSRRHLFHNIPPLVECNNVTKSLVHNAFSIPFTNSGQLDGIATFSQRDMLRSLSLSHQSMPIVADSDTMILAETSTSIILDTANTTHLPPITNTTLLNIPSLHPTNDLPNISRFRPSSLHSQPQQLFPISRFGDIIISADFAAVFDHHPQDNLNQAILLHSGQFVVIVTYAEMIQDFRLTRNIAFHYWLRLG